MFLIGWIVVLALVSLIVGVLRGNP